MSVTHQPLSMRPLGQNNSQQHIGGQRQTVGKKSNKITAKADSTGLENSSAIAKHHHSVKKMQTASVVKEMGKCITCEGRDLIQIGTKGNRLERGTKITNPIVIGTPGKLKKK